MKHFRLTWNSFLTGTLLLTITGVLSRIIGFFYRIFLSRTIGAEGLGIYQLIFPVLTLCISFTSSGIQTSISKYVAQEQGRNEKHAGIRFLYVGLFLSLLLSVIVCIFLFMQADYIAVKILGESRCRDLIRIMAYSLPFCSIHSCINGYYYGRKKTALPSITQLTEQIVRVGSVYIIYLIYTEKNLALTPSIAVWGIVCGEIASMLISVTAIRFSKYSGSLIGALKKLTRFCIPLTANRVTINLFVSIEAILIPANLKLFGYSNTDALCVFGILTGMAMPMILFPNVLTSSVSVLLLPTISEAQAACNQKLIARAIKKTIEYCMILGLFSTLFFLLTGNFIGQVVFQNTLAGVFITTLSWICPFLNLATTLTSILHGLGKATCAFVLNLTGCLIRIFFIFILVPIYGIRPYLYGMLVSQLFVSASALFVIMRFRNDCRN